MPSMLEAAHNLLADDEGILLVPQGGIKNS
jgi:hypothetical protein